MLYFSVTATSRPTNSMPSFSASINIFFILPLELPPATANLRVTIPNPEYVHAVLHWSLWLYPPNIEHVVSLWRTHPRSSLSLLESLCILISAASSYASHFISSLALISTHTSLLLLLCTPFLIDCMCVYANYHPPRHPLALPNASEL